MTAARTIKRAKSAAPVLARPTGRVRKSEPVARLSPRLEARHIPDALAAAIDAVTGTRLKRMTATSPIRSLYDSQAYEIMDVAGTGVRVIILFAPKKDLKKGPSLRVRGLPKALDLAANGRELSYTVDLKPTNPDAAYTFKPASLLLRRTDFADATADVAIFIFEDGACFRGNPLNQDDQQHPHPPVVASDSGCNGRP